jgi:hypothetical protein
MVIYFYLRQWPLQLALGRLKVYGFAAGIGISQVINGKTKTLLGYSLHSRRGYL